MLQHERSLIVARIASGYSRIKIDGRVYKLFSPNKDILYEAEEVYTDTYELAKNEGVIGEKETIALLYDMNKWSDKLELQLSEILPKNIECLKLDMLETFNDKNKLETIRKYLRKSEDEISRLFEIKNQFSHLTCHGLASFSKTQFIIEQCIDAPCNPNRILSWLNEHFVGEKSLRNVALNDPWRSIWNARKLDNLFGISACEYNELQNRITNWSILYDSIFESSEAPSMEVILDEDVCDGWLIRRRNKDKQEQVKNEYQDRLDNHKNASDVFIPVSKDELDKVSTLNGPTERAIISNRLKTIDRLKVANDSDFADVKLQIEMIKNNAGR